MDARAEGKWAYPLPTFEVRGYYPLEICEDIGSNLCNLVHFGVINKHLNINIQTFTNYQLVNYHHLPQTSANHLVLWRPVQEKVYNSVFNLEFV